MNIDIHQLDKNKRGTLTVDDAAPVLFCGDPSCHGACGAPQLRVRFDSDVPEGHWRMLYFGSALHTVLYERFHREHEFVELTGPIVEELNRMWWT